MKDIFLDSNRIKKGDIFVALKGQNTDGNKYIKDALSKGASLILSDRVNSKYFCPNLKEELNKKLLKNYYLKKLPKLIGITGTNGKSTLAYSIYKSLKNNGYKVKIITTISGVEDSYFSELTTPRNDDLMRFIKNAKDNKIDFLIMEISSIGVKEGRVNDLFFEAILTTNLESDHLDYHRCIYDYHESKLSLFNQCKHFIIENDKTLAIKHLFALLKVDIDKIELIFPRGREEIIHYNPLIIIDYAHTESAYKYVLKKYKRCSKSQLYVVFGVGGDRDKEKRNKIGKLVYELSDVRIITNDNPRYENPIDIIFQTIKGFEDKFYIIQNREKAIEYALMKLQKDDTLLVLGKGHEEYQIVDGKKIPFSDKRVIMNYLYSKT